MLSPGFRLLDDHMYAQDSHWITLGSAWRRNFDSFDLCNFRNVSREGETLQRGFELLIVVLQQIVAEQMP